MIVGSVLGTAFAITTGKGMETAITIAMPAAILSAFVVNLFYGVITPIMAKAADRFAEEGKYMKIEGVFLSNGFLFDLTFAVIAFGAFLFGGDSVTAVVNAIPGWLTDRYRYRSRHSAGTWFCAAYQYDHEQEGCGILPVRILVKRIYGNIYGWY